MEHVKMPLYFNIVFASYIIYHNSNRIHFLTTLIWHFTKPGDYTVKSGYELAVNLQRNGEIGGKGEGESSNPTRKNLF